MKRFGRVFLACVLVAIQSSLQCGSSVGAQAPEAAWPEEWQADETFYDVWAREDALVAAQVVGRSWMWGPSPLAVANEAYDESITGKRLVQYFDKARMEINDPRADRESRWFVTSGLLVYEMVSGQVQVGDNRSESREPPALPVAGDANSPNAPTYASFAKHLAPAPRATGGVVRQRIAADGTISEMQGAPSDPSLFGLAQYDEVSNHNVPAVFYDWARQSGTVLEAGKQAQAPLLDPLYVLGRPITEAYWAEALVGGKSATVLVQLYERRALTYNPANLSEWRVEMANVGRAYYDWRYKEQPVGPAIATNVESNSLLVRGWSWPAGSSVQVQVDLAGGQSPLSGPQEAVADAQGRFVTRLPISAEMESALQSSANVSVRASAGQSSTALPIAKTPEPQTQLEGTITQAPAGKSAIPELSMRGRDGREWLLLLGQSSQVLYSEGTTAPPEDVRAGTAVGVQGVVSGNRVRVSILRLMSVSTTGAKLGYIWQANRASIRVTGTGWPAEKPVAFTLAGLNSGGPPPVWNTRTDSRGNITAAISVPTGRALPVAPLWLFAIATEGDTLLAQVAVPFEPAPGSIGEPPHLYVVSQAGEQEGGLGSYCWTGGCVDKRGVPMPGLGLQVASGEALGLRSRYGPDPQAGLTPTRFSAQLYAYPANPASEGAVIDGVYYFAPRSQPIYSAEVAGKPFSVTLPATLPSGKYALLVSTVWDDPVVGKGDAIYGFTLQVPDETYQTYLHRTRLAITYYPLSF